MKLNPVVEAYMSGAKDRRKRAEDTIARQETSTISAALAAQRANQSADRADARMRERASLEGKNAADNDTRDAEAYLERLRAKRKDDAIRKDEEIYPGGKPVTPTAGGNKQLEDLMNMDGAGSENKGPGILSKIGAGLSGLFKRPKEKASDEPQVPGLKKKVR